MHTEMQGITLCDVTMPPHVVTKRVTLDAEVHTTNVRFNEDLVIVHGPKVYVNKPIFRAWIIDVLIPYVDFLRSEKLGINEETILLMGNLKVQKMKKHYN